MAPKKTLLILTLILFASLTAAQSLDITSGSDNVWVGEDTTVKFNFTEGCSQQVNVSYKFDGNEGTENIDYTSNTSFSFSKFNKAGAYNFTAACKGNTQDKLIEAGELELSALSLSYKDGRDVGYPQEKVQGSFSAAIDNEENFDFTLTEQNFSLSAGQFSGDGFEFSESKEVDFTFEATQDMIDQDDITLSALEASSSANLNIENIWQYEINSISADGEGVEDSINKEKKIKYRDLDSFELSVDITKKEELQTGLSDYFLFDGENRFDVDAQSGGTYLLKMDSTPVYPKEELNVETPKSVPIKLNTDAFSSAENDLLLADLIIEKDVEFSGNVLDVSNNRVNTDFSAFVEEKNSRYRFSTDDSGNFERFFETDTVDMDIDFPEATVSLSEMNVGKEDAGDISYQYYDNPVDQSNIDPEVDVRPVNLAAFVSNYPFQSDSLDTYVEMQYDTSNVDPLEVVVYECSQWTFDAEECSSEWEKINNNDVNLASGSTWKADFPIDPLTSERFATDHGVLQNAYLIGVPKGVGSSLTLQNSLDVSSTSLQSGEELTVSGTVIDGSTGEGVGDADLSLDLVSDSNEINLEETSNSDGSFEFSREIEEAGEYTAEFTAEKNPYESFSKESSSTIDVFYETGLTVSSESDIDLQMGQSSEIEFEIKNSGQSEVEDIELEISGIDEEHYSLSTNTISSLGTDDRTRTVTLSLDKPEEYCSDPCTSPPTISLSASGTSAGETVENSASVYTNIPTDTQQQSTDENEEADQQEQNQSSLNVPNPEQVSQMTGDFIESQSEMNLALGIILIFGAILAVTVRKRKEGGDDRTNRVQGRMSQGGAASARGNVQRPDVSPSSEEDQKKSDDSEEATESKQEPENDGNEKNEEENAEEKEEEEDDSNESDGEFVCDTCGEEFDTESGLKLHEDALH